MFEKRDKTTFDKIYDKIIRNWFLCAVAMVVILTVQVSIVLLIAQGCILIGASSVVPVVLYGGGALIGASHV